MLEEFQKYVDKYRLIDKDDKIFVAFSGGVDSMVLTNLLMYFKYDIALGHCNFHLRGEESDRDENFVRQFADNKNLRLFVKHFDTEKYAKENGISIEMAARELRYSWFSKMMTESPETGLIFTKVALAHHGDDQLETFFINLLRGSGIKGLKGMKPRNSFYIRPLLWSNRRQIEDFAKNNNIKWVEDHTNQETIYLRNKIRHRLLPLFDEIKENARQSIKFSIDCISSENDLYRELIHNKLSKIEIVKSELRSIENRHFFESENGKQMLFEWIRDYGFSYDDCESIMDAIKSKKSGKVFYSENYILSIQNEIIEIFDKKDADLHEYIIKDKEAFIEKPFPMSFSLYDKSIDFQLIKDPRQVAQFDAEKIRFPLMIRHWKNGDRFKPMGMKGSKLLSDFFNDLGFSMYEKQNVWLMTDAERRIIWVIGYRINDNVKVLESTKSIFQCNLN